MRAPWLGLGLLMSCSRPSHAPEVALVVPTGSPAPEVPAPPEPVACWIAAGYRGAVLGLPVFVRLARDGGRLHGRYFYERSGIDIALDGSLSDDGTMHVVEGPAAASTGRFDGRCEPDTGAFAGRWQGGSRGGDFRWAPVPPGEVPVVAVRRFTVARPERRPGAESRITQCSYRESRVELFGLRDQGVEHAVDRQGVEPLRVPVLDPALARGVDRCEEGFEAEVSQRLVYAYRELATLETQGWIDGGGAHPAELDFARGTVDLRTGHPVTSQDVFVPRRDLIDRVAECAGKTTQFDIPMDADDWRSHLDLSQFDVAEDGVHFFGTSFPHVMAVLAGQGPVIHYDVLLRDGYLRTDSPVKRAWKGVEPAAKGRGFCPDVAGDAGWR
jgi:hypothetical protein